MKVKGFEFSVREFAGSLGDFGTLLPFTVGYIVICGFNPAGLLLGIGLSMVADQITPLIDRKKCYFTKARLAESILFHIFIAIIAIMIFYI